MSWWNLYSALGCCTLVLLAWLTSTNRRGVSWRTAAAAAATVAVMGILVFWWPFFRVGLVALNGAVTTLLNASGAGARFLFGPLAASPGQEESLGFILAFQVFPAVVFFSVIVSLLYHFGVLPFVVRNIARWVHRGFGISGAEALATSSNLFVGVESTLTVRPFLERMTRSELTMVLTSGLSTIASSVLAVYAGLLEPIFPYIAGHLISASVLSIPAAVLMSKIIVPEEDEPQTRRTVPPMKDFARSPNWMGSLIQGANDGVRLSVGVGALLIGMLGLVELLDVILGTTAGWVSNLTLQKELDLTLRTLLSWVAYPLVLCLGLTPDEWPVAARLIGERWVLTEVVAYQDLASVVAAGELSPRGLMVLSYALCGFTHVPSVAIFAGGLSVLVPARRNDLARLSWPALWAATLATLMTGAAAGLFYHGQEGLMGL